LKGKNESSLKIKGPSRVLAKKKTTSSDVIIDGEKDENEAEEKVLAELLGTKILCRM